MKTVVWIVIVHFCDHSVSIKGIFSDPDAAIAALADLDLFREDFPDGATFTRLDDEYATAVAQGPNGSRWLVIPYQVGRAYPKGDNPYFVAMYGRKPG